MNLIATICKKPSYPPARTRVSLVPDIHNPKINRPHNPLARAKHSKPQAHLNIVNKLKQLNLTSIGRKSHSHPQRKSIKNFQPCPYIQKHFSLFLIYH